MDWCVNWIKGVVFKESVWFWHEIHKDQKCKYPKVEGPDLELSQSIHQDHIAKYDKPKDLKCNFAFITILNTPGTIYVIYET